MTKWLVLVVLMACAERGAESESPKVPVSGTTDPSSRTEAPAPRPEGKSADGSARDRGLRAIESGDFDVARGIFEALVASSPGDGEARYYLALCNDRLGRAAEAEKGYREAAKVRPDLEPVYVNLSALLLDARRAPEALTVVREGLQRHSASASLRLNGAVAMATQGDKEGATRWFREALGLPALAKDPTAHLTAGHWFAQWKDKDAAIKELLLARTHAARDLGLLVSVGHELRMAGAFLECVDVLGDALAIKEVGEARTERALCLLGLSKEKEALAELKTATEKSPGYAPAFYYLGGRWASAGQWHEALRAYEAYLALEPQGSLAEATKERVRLVRQKMGAKR